jgi:hypothetical protein
MGSRIRKRSYKKRKKRRKTRKRGGTFFAEPSFYAKKVASVFTVQAPDAYGNKSNVPPFPYFQSK